MYDDTNQPPNQGQDMNQQQPIGQNMNPTAQQGISGGQPQKTAVTAILSLVFAFLFWPAGLILGIVALVKINHNPNLKGKGLAIAGIIISVLVVPMIFFMMIGSLAYFGVLAPQNMLPERCQFSAGLQCSQTAVFDASEDSITFALKNDIGYEIEGLSVKESSICTGSTVSKDTVPNGDSVTITLTGCDLTDGRSSSVDVNLMYTNPNTGMQHMHSGSIIGRAS